MTYLLYILGVLAMAFGIGLSIALHELGHLVPAKRFGVKVKQYMIGFGPTIASWRRGETEYGLKAIPLGGYVRMIGMLPPQSPGNPRRLRASSTGRLTMLADQARKDSMEEIAPGEQDRVFYRLSTPKKITVMLGGPLMNLLIAAVLLTGYVTLYGVLDERRPIGATVTSVSRCVPATVSAGPTDGRATDGSSDPCAGRPKAPAYAAGLLPRDRIVGIDGRPVTVPADISTFVRPSAGRALRVDVVRAEGTKTLTITPASTDLQKLTADGKPVTGPDGKVVTERGGFLGTTTRGTFETVRQPITEAPKYVWNAMAGTASVMLRIPEKMVGVWNAAFGDGERDVNGPISVVGVGRVAGEKAGGEITGSIMDDIAVVPFLVQLLAGLNMALFVFNLIPLMPLDGGQIAGALWEGLKRTVARMTGRPDPGHVDVARALPLAYAVSVVLISMSVLLIYADLVKPVRF